MIIDNTSSEATLSSQAPTFLQVHIVSVEMHQASVKKTGTMWHKSNTGSSLVHSTNTVTWLADLTMKQFVKPGAYISKRLLILLYSSKTCPSVAFCWQSHELNECPISHRTLWAMLIILAMMIILMMRMMMWWSLSSLSVVWMNECAEFTAIIFAALHSCNFKD